MDEYAQFGPMDYPDRQVMDTASPYMQDPRSDQQNHGQKQSIPNTLEVKHSNFVLPEAASSYYEQSIDPLSDIAMESLILPKSDQLLETNKDEHGRSIIDIPNSHDIDYSSATAKPEVHVQHLDPPLLAESESERRCDPIINIVAPDEIVTPDSYRMYSANGTPLDDFQAADLYSNDKNESIAGDLKNKNANWGNPQTSSMQNNSLTPLDSSSNANSLTPTIALSPATSFSSASSIMASPVLSAAGSQSPSEPFYNLVDDVLSPLIDDNQRYLDDPVWNWEAISGANTPVSNDHIFDDLDLADSWVGTNRNQKEHRSPFGTLTRTPSFKKKTSDTLHVPHSRGRSRTLSDSWTESQRGRFLETLDQHLRSNSITTSPGPNSPVSSYDNVQDPVDKDVQGLSQQSYENEQMQPFMRFSSPNIPSDFAPEARRDPINSYDTNNTQKGLVTNDQFKDKFKNTEYSQPDQNGKKAVTPDLPGSYLQTSSYDQANDLRNLPTFCCKLCGKQFTRAYNLRSHMRTHTDERPFACQHCGKAFARQHDRKRHETLHSGQKKFACSGTIDGVQWGCQKRFARADALGRHFRTDAGRSCLKPVVERIQSNGTRKETAPEGILFNGFIGNKPQLFLNVPRRDSGNLSTTEREEQTRRTVIVTAVSDYLQSIVTNIK